MSSPFVAAPEDPSPARCLWRVVALSQLWAALSLAVVAGAVGADSGPTQSLADAMAAIDSPGLSAAQEPPEVIHLGRAEIRPEPGSKVSHFRVDGRPAGFLLEGPAQFVYRVEDRFSIPSARYNLDQANGFEVREADGVLTAATTLEGAAVWGWDLDLGLEVTEAEAGRDLPDWLRSILDDRMHTEPASGLLQEERNSDPSRGDPGVRWGIFEAKGEVLRLSMDPRATEQSERLSTYAKIRDSRMGPLSSKRSFQLLAQQPIDKQWWEAEVIDFVAVDTELEVDNERGDHVRVTTKTRLQAQRGGLRLLPMWLQSGQLDPSASWRDYRVTRLTVNGQPADYVHRHQTLLVELPKTLQQGESVELEVESEGEILIRPQGDNYWRLGGGGWYAKPGYGGNEWAEIRVTARVAEPYRPFSAGTVVARESGESSNMVQTRLQAPMNMAMVVAGKYRTVSGESKGAKVHISSYAAVKEREADRVAQVVFSVQDCLSTWLGVPYPFPELQVVELNQWGWGQAPPGLIFITKEAFLTRASARVDDDTTLRASAYSRGINERMAHEVAHAWFPHVAKVLRGEENWLSESLADYASAVCLEKRMSNQRKGRQLFERQLREWKRRSAEAGDASSVYLAHLLSGSESGRIRRDLLYGRGPLVLHSIRQQLAAKHGEEKGDQIFFTWIRSYIKNFTFKQAETRHLIAILEQMTGEPWQPFFERHIYGNEPPTID